MSERSEQGLSRREALIRTAAATFAATGLSTPGVVFAQNNNLPRTPGVTEGPYWVDGQLNRSDLRTDTATGTALAGFPLLLSVNVCTLVNNAVQPVPNAQVDLWSANPAGVYSAVAAQNTVGHNFLRGYQFTNARGLAKFTTLYPGWYRGRAVHEHFRVRLYSGTTVAYNFVSQFFFDDAVSTAIYTLAPYNTRGNRDTLNAGDMVYTGASQGNGLPVANNAGTYLLLRLAGDGTHAIGSFNVVL